MKIFNISYNDPDILEEVYSISGKPFSFWNGLKRGGTGTPRGIMSEVPEVISEKYKFTESLRYCSFREMKDGILLCFNIRQETFAIPMSFREIKKMEWRKPGTQKEYILDLETGSSAFAISYNSGYVKSIDRFLKRSRVLMG